MLVAFTCLYFLFAVFVLNLFTISFPLLLPCILFHDMAGNIGVPSPINITIDITYHIDRTYHTSHILHHTSHITYQTSIITYLVSYQHDIANMPHITVTSVSLPGNTWAPCPCSTTADPSTARWGSSSPPSASRPSWSTTTTSRSTSAGCPPTRWTCTYTRIWCGRYRAGRRFWRTTYGTCSSPWTSRPQSYR